MSVVAIVPARGGSKAIPRKNLCELGGIPLVLHSVFHAADSSLVDRVIVSTDDDEIASVCADFEVVRRPAYLATDEATTDGVLVDAVRQLHLERDTIVLLQPTSPFRTTADIDATVRALEHNGVNSAFTACEVPFTWSGAVNMAGPTCYNPRSRPNRQQATKEWVENGAVYATFAAELLHVGHRMSWPRRIVPMGWLESMQIDEPADLEAARALWTAIR